MADDPKEIVTLQISDAELERRWSATRARMKEERMDALVMQETNEWLGGYVKWFTDVSARQAYPMSVVFPVDDLMTTVMSGGRPPQDMGPPAWTLRGVKSRLTAPYFSSVTYSATYDAELVVRALQDRKNGKIGIVGTGKMAIAYYQHLVKQMPQATFVDATDLVDRIKAIKSPEEIELVRKTCALQDEVMAYAKTVVRPGRKVFEIVADVVHKAIMLGSEEQLVMGGSAPFGRPASYQKRQYQNRTVRESEPFTLLVEVNGPGGMYAELGRIFFTGEVPAELSDAWELCREAQKVTLYLLKPGADPKEAWDANNEFLRRHGKISETRLYAHGQGYDLVERPAIRDDEPMHLAANMNIVVHPSISTERVWASVCDNYLITETGVSPCLHTTPQEIFSV